MQLILHKSNNSFAVVRYISWWKPVWQDEFVVEYVLSSSALKVASLLVAVRVSRTQRSLAKNKQTKRLTYLLYCAGDVLWYGLFVLGVWKTPSSSEGKFWICLMRTDASTAKIKHHVVASTISWLHKYLAHSHPNKNALWNQRNRWQN